MISQMFHVEHSWEKVMPMVEIEGNLIDSFNLAWETVSPSVIVAKAVAREIKFTLEDKLMSVIQQRGQYSVSVIISELEDKNATSKGKESQVEEGILRERQA